MTRRRSILLIIGVLVLFGGVGVLIATLSGPANGTVLKQSLNSTETKSVVDTLIPVNTTYASFSYPAAFKAQAVDPVRPPVLISYSYAKPDVTHWQLSVTIVSVAQANLEADSSYALRASQPKNYQRSTLTTSTTKQTFTVMRYNPGGGYDAVAYSLHGNQVAEIALKGVDNHGNATVQATFEQVLATWHWQYKQ